MCVCLLLTTVHDALLHQQPGYRSMPLYIKCSGNAGATYRLTSKTTTATADFFLQDVDQKCNGPESKSIARFGRGARVTRSIYLIRTKHRQVRPTLRSLA